MILVTHGIIGGAAAAIFTGNPVIAFFVGFVSHFLADAIPHWHYYLKTFVHDRANEMNNDLLINKDSFKDLSIIGLDFLAGILIPLFLFGDLGHFSSLLTSPIFWGALGGTFPDPLQFVYFKFPKQPFVSLERFHLFIHAKQKLDKKPLIGISSQTLIAILALGIGKFFS